MKFIIVIIVILAIYLAVPVSVIHAAQSRKQMETDVEQFGTLMGYYTSCLQKILNEEDKEIMQFAKGFIPRYKAIGGNLPTLIATSMNMGVASAGMEKWAKCRQATESVINLLKSEGIRANTAYKLLNKLDSGQNQKQPDSSQETKLRGVFLSTDPNGPTLILYQDGTGKMVFDKRVARVDWVKNGSILKTTLWTPNSNTENIKVDGKLTGNNKIELEGFTFIKTNENKLYTYKYQGDGLTGDLSIADVSKSHNRFMLEIETAAPRDSDFIHTCSVSAECKKYSNVLVCKQNVDKETAQDLEVPEDAAIVINGFPGNNVTIESTYPTGLNCGMCEYAGRYVSN